MFINSGTFREIFAATTANMMSFMLGSMTTWLSACYHYFHSPDTSSPIGNVSMSYISWLTSLPYLSSLLGIFIWGNLSERYGRKTTGLILALPYTIMYLLLYFSHNQMIILVGRILGGFSNIGAILCVNLYVKEISSNENRAKLSNMLTLSIVSGALYVITLGAFVSYDTVNLLLLTVCVLYLFLFSLLPESPIYQLQKGQYDNAKKSLQWLRKIQNENILDEEIEKLQELFLNKVTIQFSQIFKNKYYFKTMLIGLFLQTTILSFTGFSVIVTFSSQIFEIFVHDENVAMYNIIFTCCQLLGGLITFFVIDRFGRISLIVFTCFAMSAILCTLAVCHFINFQPFSTFPIILFIAYILLFGSICFPVIYSYFNELISSESSNHIFTIMVLGKNLGFFFTIKLYVYLFETFSIVTVLMTFSIGSLIVGIITLFFPETKNKSLQTLKRELKC